MSDKELKIVISAIDKATAPINAMGSSLKGVLSGVSSAMFSLGKVGAVAIAGLGAVGLKTAGDFEQTSIAFKTMLGDADKASALLKELSLFAASTPFEFPEIANAGKSLLAFGFAAKDVKGTLTTLGDIASSLNIPLGELSEIYGKIKTSGRVFSEDINQLTGRGIPIIAELAKQFGVAEGEVKNLVEKGKVGFPEIQKAMESMAGEGGKFAGGMVNQSQSLNGLLSTAKDGLGNILNEIIGINQSGEITKGSILEGAKESLSSISKWAEQNKELSKNIVLVTVAVTGLALALGALGLIIPPIMVAFTAIGVVFGAITLPVLSVIAVFVAVGVAIYEVWKNWDTIKPKLIAIWEGIKTGLEEIWNGLKAAWNFVWEGMKAALDLVLTAIGVALGLFIQLITGDFDGFFANIKALWSLFWNGLKTVMSAIWEGIKTVVKLAWEGLSSIFTLGIETLTGWFGAEGRQKIYDNFTGMFSGLGEFVSGVFDGIVSGIKKAINFAISLANSLIEKANSLPGVELPTIPTLSTAPVSGARALGGPVSANRSYLVGENGPEIFSPGSSGKINNNPSGGGQTININLGGVTVQNSADEDRLVDKIRKVLIRETQLYSNGIA